MEWGKLGCEDRLDGLSSTDYIIVMAGNKLNYTKALAIFSSEEFWLANSTCWRVLPENLELRSGEDDVIVISV